MTTTEYRKPLPKPTETDTPYWDGLKNHELLIQHCRKCETYQWYPRVICSNCTATELEFKAVRPAGTVYTYTVQHHSTGSKFDGDLPFATVVVRLDDVPNVRVVGFYAGNADEVHIGLPVAGDYLDATEDVSLLVFNRTDKPSE